MLIETMHANLFLVPKLTVVAQVDSNMENALYMLADMAPLKEFLFEEMREGRFKPKSTIGFGP